MNVQMLQPAAVEIETLGAWRLDGREIEVGTRIAVLPSLASDLVMRGKARRVLAADAAPAAPADPTLEPTAEPPAEIAPETPPAPATPVRGKK